MTEKKRSRDSYTRSLIKICNRLDQTNTASFDWTHPFIYVDCHSTFTLNRLWIAGSYARGAPTCGDLDLVADVTWDSGPDALPNEILKALGLRLRGVSICVGSPEQNSSQVAFPEAVLIWDGRGHDWQSAILSIALNPNAGRFVRSSDCIPFRLERLGCNIEGVNHLLDLHDWGHIKWQFTPFDSICGNSSAAKHQSTLASFFSSRGKASQLLGSHLLYYFHFDSWPSSYRREWRNKSSFFLGDSVVSIGRPTVSLGLLDKGLTARLLIAPHLSKDGPNGVWSIERGDRHPLVAASAGLKIWALLDIDGQLDFYHRAHHKAKSLSYSYTAIGIDLFTTKQEVEAWIRLNSSDSKCLSRPISLNPNQLLSCLAAVDAVAIDFIDFALTRRGATTVGLNETVNLEKVFSVLAGDQH